jgi:hypothetical protein
MPFSNGNFVASGDRHEEAGNRSAIALIGTPAFAKVEYQFVDLGTQTVQLIAQNNLFTITNFTPSSFSATFHDRFNVVRPGLNYRF